MNFITLGVTQDGYYKVELIAATRNYFEIKQGENPKATLEMICLMIPRILRLDEDFMEAFDNAERTEPSNLDIKAVKDFARLYTFRNVDCGLPGFEMMIE